MDNLDRTNVVQASLAKYTLTLQLRELGIISPTENVDDFGSLSQDFRESQLSYFWNLFEGS
jgi:hypothetical protein